MGPEIWVLEKPLHFVGTRMTVVRLPDGSLWVHSPVNMNEEDYAELEGLGEVRYIVSPNNFHHFYLKAFCDRYPKAELWAVPQLEKQKKTKGLPTPHLLEPGKRYPWSSAIETVVVDAGKLYSEAVFFHGESRTLILTDLAINLKDALKEAPMKWRYLGKLVGVYDTFGPSRLLKLVMRKRENVRASRDEILRWDVDKVVVSHGEVLIPAGRETVEQAFSWL
jgi:hypothetical protein